MSSGEAKSKEIQVPFSRPSIGEDEIAELVDAIRSGWLTTGPRTARFEREFAAHLEAGHAVGTNSCTGALHIALKAIGVQPGDEVVTSTMTFAATANVIVHVGARPVFGDVDPDTLNLSLDEVRARLTPRTRALIAVHYAGRPCRIQELRALCLDRGIALIEDCAHAVGASLDGQACGTFGQASAFSFYANKNMTTGEGGMFVTSDEALAARARILRLQGMTRDAFGRGSSRMPSWHYDIVEAGFKYAMSDVQAALGIHQLRKLEEFQAARGRRAARYTEALAGVPGLRLLAPEGPRMRHAHHLYVIRVTPEARLSRDRLFEALAARGIQASLHFVPLHLHPYYREAWGYQEGDFPAAEEAYREILSLPLFAGMTDEQQEHVIETIRGALGA